MSGVFRKSSLLAGAAVAALLAGTSGVLAQSAIHQNVDNSASVANWGGNDIFVNGPVSGVAASATVSTSGARTSVSVLGVNTGFISPLAIGPITQNSHNTGMVITPWGFVDVDGDLGGHGSAAAISASGSGAVVGVTGIGAGFSGQTIGNVWQVSANEGFVFNHGHIDLDHGSLSGLGSSASVSASGASSAVVTSFINASSGMYGGPNASVGDVAQLTTNDAWIINSGGITISDSYTYRAGLVGDGASASVSASGASSVVAFSFNNVSGWGNSSADAGNVWQVTLNGFGAPVSNWGNIVIDGNYARQVGVIGDGASASVSAVGASSAVVASFVDVKANAANSTAGNVGQTTLNGLFAPVTNNGYIGIFGDHVVDVGVIGNGASVSISAAGASSAVASNFIDVSASGVSSSVGNVGQVTANGAWAPVYNYGTIEISGDQGHGSGHHKGPQSGVGVFGNGASVSISAVGASSVVASSFIGVQTNSPSSSVGNVFQATANGFGAPVTNNGNISIEGGHAGVYGDGASVTVSAAGASSAVAASFNNTTSGWFDPSASVGNVFQVTLNGALAPVTNYGSIVGSPIAISGDGALVAISATGASSAVSVSFINSTGHDYVSIGNVGQVTVNLANVTNYNGYGLGTVRLHGISGDGAAASIGASGAVSSVSVTAINDDYNNTLNTNLGSIGQTTINTGRVTNYGGSIVNCGPISGNGASASISANGAVSAISVTSINGNQFGSTSVGPISQTALNTGAVTNFGHTISTGAITGNAASASISAVGASAGVSFSAIK